MFKNPLWVSWCPDDLCSQKRRLVKCQVCLSSKSLIVVTEMLSCISGKKLRHQKLFKYMMIILTNFPFCNIKSHIVLRCRNYKIRTLSLPHVLFCFNMKISFWLALRIIGETMGRLFLEEPLGFLGPEFKFWHNTSFSSSLL